MLKAASPLKQFIFQDCSIAFYNDDLFFIGNILNQNAISKTKPAIIKKISQCATIRITSNSGNN